MNKNKQILEVVDENDNVIGLETREKIHKGGLLHREIHIWFLTPNGEIIFQHRAKDKDTYPDKLDATVGGHVEPKMSYEETAVKECKEETGIDLELENLKFLTKRNFCEIDEATKMINHSLRTQYAYLYKDSIDELIVEKGEAVGFEAWKIDDLSELSNNDKNKFIPRNVSGEFLSLFNRAKKIFALK